MRRALIALVVGLSLSLGAAVAQGHQFRGAWGPGDSGSGFTPKVAVAGTIVSVDPSSNSFVANAVLIRGEGCGFGHFRGHDPGGWGGWGGFGRDDCQFGLHRDWGHSVGSAGGSAPQQVTITTDGSTMFRVNGQTATISDLAPGDRFVALFPMPTDTMWDGGQTSGVTLQQVVASPALAVFATAPPAQRQLYAFVGTVSAVDTTADTLTVNVTNSIPAGFVTSPATFTVSPDTLILGGNATGGLFGGSLTGVSAGDVVAGGLIGTAGETLAQVEATPLQALIDFPMASSGTTTSSTAKARRRTLNQALKLLGVKTHSKHARHHSKKARHHRSRHDRTRA
jgi:hypothetical protein